MLYFKSKVWGPFGWYFLHSISYYTLYNKLSANEIEGIKLIIHSLTYIIPCPECRKHFGQKYKKVNLDILLKNPNEFINWVIKIHNEVNKSNKKPQYTREKVDKLYTLNNSKQILNQHQIIKFVDILIKGGKYLPVKQREDGFKKLILGLSKFYPEQDVSNRINNILEKNVLDYKKLLNIERFWDFVNQNVLGRLKCRDNNLCFEVSIKHNKTNLSDIIYFKPNICGIQTLKKWEHSNNKVKLECKNYDSSMNNISFDLNPDFKILNIKSLDYLDLTIDIRLGKKKNNIIHF